MLREFRDWLEELVCRAGFDGLPTSGRSIALIVAVAVAALLAWSLLGSPAHGTSGIPSPTTPAPSSGPGKTAESSSSAKPARSATVTVHVVGEVRHPGVYELAGGARARDAVAAAGGLLGDAEEAAVNLARPVVDGEQIAVPRQGEAASAPSAADGVSGSAGAGGKVDLNTATAEQLDALPGVGPATAAKIVSDRTANGPFKSVDDLMRVSGIGPAKFEALKELVSAN